jgi:NAD(P)H-dependent flavin oxidoreductase YrpB (nitropropane dioxygenase family)
MSTFLDALELRLPLIQAPMAGGPDTPALAAAVSNAGGLGSLGVGYLSPEKIAETFAAMRSLTSKPFALNLFMRPGPFGRRRRAYAGRRRARAVSSRAAAARAARSAEGAAVGRGAARDRGAPEAAGAQLHLRHADRGRGLSPFSRR